MSRIHDALKKAELERAAAQAAEVSALPGDLQTPAPTKPRNAAPGAAADVSTQTSVITPALGDDLRFDELWAHCACPPWHPDPKTNVFLNPALSAQGAEQFRTLRSRLYQFRTQRPLQTLLITSSVAGEGKTFVASNLAQAIVRQPDRRALIIDADLRLSRLHVPLGAPPTPGLTDYLRGQADELAILQHAQEGGLCFIPGGNAVTNPSELLSNGRLKILLDRLAPSFDWVILDSPPCVPIADASVLADICDGLLLVVRARSTPLEVVRKACQQLHGRNVVGVVLNGVGEEILGYGGYYKSGYYGHIKAKNSKKQEPPRHNGNGTP